VEASCANQGLHSKVGILNANMQTKCITMLTGRLWDVVWQSSRELLTRAIAREWGGCYGEHVDQDTHRERACVQGYSLVIYILGLIGRKLGCTSLEN
jgi:hypothetical protein